MATGNRGVSALGASLVKLFYEAAPGSEAVMLISNRNDSPFEVNVGTAQRTVPVVNFRVSPRSEPKKNLFVIMALSFAYKNLPFSWARGTIRRFCPWIKCVASAALVGDIRGGDSFTDMYGSYSFAIASLPVIAVIWIRGRVVLFPQTYGPFQSSLSRNIAKYILRRADRILTRDRESAETIYGLIGQTEKVQFCPDVAFSLEPVRPLSFDVVPPITFERGSCLVGINVNGLMYNGGYTRQNMFGLKLDYVEFLNKLMVALLKQTSNQILLVPHTFGAPGNVESDPDACRLVMEAVSATDRRRVHLVNREYDQHEIKGIIGGCDVFIGSRLHSCIAALSQGIPTIGVAYSKKFKGVFETVGAGDWVIDGREMRADVAVSAVEDRIEHRAAIRATLIKESGRARELLRRHFSSFITPTDA